MIDKELIETRASILWWFSTVLSNELNEQQFNSYINEQGANLLNQLATEDKLAEAIKSIQQSLQLLKNKPHPHLECAVEFTQLFLMDAKKGAPPYASVYLSKDGLMFQKAHDEMCALLQEQGLSVNKTFNEPADHIAIQLDYLGNLILASLNATDNTEACDKQLQFINNNLMNWLPKFISKINQTDNSGFYQNILKVLSSYLLLEVEFLKEEINA
ncbi:molecular chaperone TorD [Thalassotalea psychrophila]|uniref:Chaperone protein TorD n=1 Tax=Thalassotalea psychrophila TaxID=3065647 RepID=A0ABY9TSF4_9GAMM|nr:molecular chaperone TorD [Colwelliaceae bacterium SQ149]